YPYRDLSPQAFESVLEMVSGRFVGHSSPPSPPPRGRGVGGEGDDEATPSPPTPLPPGAGGAGRPPPASGLAALQPRVSWDRVHNRLHALPGSQQMALVNGGTIPDTGQYAAYTTNGVRIGELDEEFIYERRLGDAFLLGTNAWQLVQIEADRVLVAPAEGAPALVPFWRGENTGRSHDLGLAVGGFLRELAERIHQPDCLAWLDHNYFLDRRAAHDLRHHVLRQLDGSGALPTDRTVVVEASRDQLGDWQVILLSPFGSRLHLALRLALE